MVIEKAKEYDDALYTHHKFKDSSPEHVLRLLAEGQTAQVSCFVCLGLLRVLLRVLEKDEENDDACCAHIASLNVAALSTFYSC